MCALLQGLIILFLSRQLYARNTLSSKFPNIQDTKEVLMLSRLVYQLESCASEDLPSEFPSNLSCEYFEEKKKNGTKVAVIRSEKKKYIAVVFAGTDSKADALYNAYLKTVRFGPEGSPLVKNKHVKVYAGFNKQVFCDGLYERLLAFISDALLNRFPTYRLLVTGHSMGGANSILTSVAFAIAFSSSNNNILVENISVASPRTGTEQFRIFANNLKNLSMWRLVLKDDIVPRLPPSTFHWKHPGHTVQMSEKGIFSYYLHCGDDELGYSGVGSTWNRVPYLKPVSGYLNHKIQAYIDYVQELEFTSETDYLVNSFVTTDRQIRMADLLVR